MTDVLLDSTGDLAWENGLIQTVDGNEEVLQRLKIALETGLGEWAFDTSAGFPYRLISTVKGATDTLIEGAARGVIERITGPGSIRAITIIRDAALRTVVISVDTIYGPPVEVTL